MDNLQQENLTTITPLMAASIAVLREWVHDHAGEMGTNLLDGVIHAFRTEPPDYTASQAPEQVKIIFPDGVMSELAQFKAESWNKYCASPHYDPFLDSDDPWDAFDQLSKEYSRLLKQNEYLKEENTRLELEKGHLLEENTRIVLEKGKLREELEQLRHLASVPAGPAPKSFDEADVPSDADLEKIFNQRGIPALKENKKHLGVCAEIVRGQGVTSAITIAGRLDVSRSVAAELIRVVQSCYSAVSKDKVSDEQFIRVMKKIAQEER